MTKRVEGRKGRKGRTGTVGVSGVAQRYGWERWNEE